MLVGQEQGEAPSQGVAHEGCPGDALFIQQVQESPGEGRQAEIEPCCGGGAAVGGEIRGQEAVMPGQGAEVIPPGKARGPQAVEQHQGETRAGLPHKPIPAHKPTDSRGGAARRSPISR